MRWRREERNVAIVVVRVVVVRERTVLVRVVAAQQPLVRLQGFGCERCHLVAQDREGVAPRRRPARVDWQHGEAHFFARVLPEPLLRAGVAAVAAAAPPGTVERGAQPLERGGAEDLLVVHHLVDVRLEEQGDRVVVELAHGCRGHGGTARRRRLLSVRRILNYDPCTLRALFTAALSSCTLSVPGV